MQVSMILGCKTKGGYGKYTLLSLRMSGVPRFGTVSAVGEGTRFWTPSHQANDLRHALRSNSEYTKLQLALSNPNFSNYLGGYRVPMRVPTDTKDTSPWSISFRQGRRNNGCYGVLDY